MVNIVVKVLEVNCKAQWEWLLVLAFDHTFEYDLSLNSSFLSVFHCEGRFASR